MLVNHRPSQQSSKDKILRISYKDHIANEGVRAKIQQAIGPHKGLLTIVKRRKLQCYGTLCLPFIRSGQNHLARHSERGKKTRQTEEDNIREWTGLEVAKSQRATENRKIEETECEIIHGALTTLAVKG